MSSKFQLVTKYIQTWGCLLALALTIGFGVLKHSSVIFSGRNDCNYLQNRVLNGDCNSNSSTYVQSVERSVP